MSISGQTVLSSHVNKRVPLIYQIIIINDKGYFLIKKIKIFAQINNIALIMFAFN